jgi:hypothetical protein
MRGPWTGRCPRTSAGSRALRGRRSIAAGSRAYRATIHAGLDDAEARYVVRHETVHWLAWCTGHQQWGDPGHSMPELWGASGVLARSEMLP